MGGESGMGEDDGGVVVDPYGGDIRERNRTRFAGDEGDVVMSVAATNEMKGEGVSGDSRIEEEKVAVVGDEGGNGVSQMKNRRILMCQRRRKGNLMRRST